MSTMENIELIVGRLEGKLGAFIEIHNADMERLNEKLNDNKNFLEKEVAKALNSHAENKQDLAQLKQRHFTCPIQEVQERVGSLEELTSKDKFLKNNPDIKKGDVLIKTIKFIGWVFAGIIITLSIINLVQDLLK